MASVAIAIERLLESEVEEISRDGQEKYAPQLSMSEKLAKLAQKIDFLSDVSGHDEDEEKKEEDEKKLVTFQPSLWPWDSVREKLRKSLTEVCVLSDVLNVVRNKKYVVLDPVSQNQATQKQTLSFLNKKKSLANAADILLHGAQRMSDAVKERAEHLSQSGNIVKDFHSELMMLRRKWRLKRAGNSIMGDLTYRSAGSQFRNPGLFEVTKAVTAEDKQEQLSSEDRALEVNISSDLKGTAKISVTIMESGQQLETATISSLPCISHEKNSTVPIPLWQRKLKSTQFNLYCKELFVQLSQEAYNTRENRPQFVMANEIRAEIFPGTDLCVTYSCREDNSDEVSVGSSTNNSTPDNQCLEYVLHALLRKRHHQAQGPPTPRPITAAHPIQGSSKRLCLAGASALTAAEVTPSLKSESLLETVLNISRHKVLQKRVVTVVDKISAQFSDPCVTCHWSTVSSNTSCLAAVHISSVEVGNLSRVSFQLRVGVKGIHIVNADGLSLDLSTHARDLEDFILTQICNHRLSVAHSLARSLGWHVIHWSRHVGTGPMEHQGHVAGLLVKSPNGSKSVAVRAGPSSGVSVLVRRPAVPSGVDPELLGNMNWGCLGGDFSEVQWSKMPGKTFVQKILLLLATEVC